jgi:G3E family GTPase
MIKIDLITGFLGSGKTTFIKRYARYLMSQGMNIGILENDYGAVNVDMMLLQELRGEQCELEMVAGGCDADCHRRRFKTKLIAMGMSGYDRVLVEPSGIFDMDEFFDALYEEPLCRWYEIGSVIAVVDAGLEENLSEQSEYLLASQIAHAGKVILSKCQNVSQADMDAVIAHMNRSMERVRCRRRFDAEVLCKDWKDLDARDYEELLQCGYVAEDYVKTLKEDSGYTTLYFMNLSITEEELRMKIRTLMQDSSYGNIFRIKGFFMTGEDQWAEVNATQKTTTIQPIPNGQEIIIVIGEQLEEEAIRRCLEGA